MSNLRDKECTAISKMLSIISKEGSEDFGDQWKVLVYDNDCRDVISPLMNVSMLRQKGVTLHLSIHTDREAIPDAPAIYFVKPTEENLKRVVTDCGKKLYRSIHLHFLTRVERPILEKFAQDLVQSGPESVALITRVVDEYLDVISLERNLFSLNIPHSFAAFNKANVGEADIKAFMMRLSMGLLSMVRILGVIPIIRCAPGGPSEMLARQFFQLLKDNISPRGPAYSLLANSLVSDRPRPLLVIYDRSADLFPLLQHSSTYQALMDDLLDHHHNRVNLIANPTSGSTASTAANSQKKKVYDLNSQLDPFFARYRHSLFPEAVEANERELNEVCKKEAELRASSSASSATTSATAASSSLNPSNSSDNFEFSPDLSAAVDSLPDILHRKSLLEMHTSLLQAIMKEVAAREVPSYVEVEESIWRSRGSWISSYGVSWDPVQVETLLKDSQKGSCLDKARLFLICCFMTGPQSSSSGGGASSSGGDHSTSSSSSNNSSGGGSSDLWSRLEAALAAGWSASASTTPSMASLTPDRVRQLGAWIRQQRSLASASFGSSAFSTSSTSAALPSFLSSATSHATSFMAKAASIFTKGNPLNLTRILDALTEGKLTSAASVPEVESYLTLDPLSTSGSSSSSASYSSSSSASSSSSSAAKFEEAIVFVIGGGCYAEYENLLQLLQERPFSNSSSSMGASLSGSSGSSTSGNGSSTLSTSSLKSILYGSSEILNGDKFLQELNSFVN